MQANREAFANDYQNYFDGTADHDKEIHRTNIAQVRNTQRLSNYKLKRRAHISHLTHATVLKTVRDTMAIPPSIIINRSDRLREDLHCDAFDIWDIAIELEVKLNISFTDAQPENWHTVRDVIDAIKLVRAIQKPCMFLVRQAD